MTEIEKDLLNDMLFAIVKFQNSGAIISVNEDIFIDYFNKAIELLENWKKKNIKE